MCALIQPLLTDQGGRAVSEMHDKALSPPPFKMYLQFSEPIINDSAARVLALCVPKSVQRHLHTSFSSALIPLRVIFGAAKVTVK